jgi:hypothetical protein
MSDTETPYIGELTAMVLDELKGRKRRGNEEELRAKDVADNQLAAKIAENAAKVAENAEKTRKVRAHYKEKAALKEKTPVSARGIKGLAYDKARTEETLRNQQRVVGDHAERAREERARDRIAQAATKMGGREQALVRMRGLLCDV